jgi:hypothetical protein
MTCPSCQSERASSTSFCPSCGSPGEEPGARPDAGWGDGAASPTSAPTAAAASAGSTSATRVLTVDEPLARPAPAAQPVRAGAPLDRRGRSVADGGREAADRAVRWWHSVGLEVQLALVGTALALVGFFLLPFAVGVGTAAEVGGRVWWRPITAVVATILLATALRPGVDPAGRQTRVTTAVALAAAGATEAGLLGIFTGNGRGLRAGYWVMLVGLVIVLVATFLATRHPVRDRDRPVSR